MKYFYIYILLISTFFLYGLSQDELIQYLETDGGWSYRNTTQEGYILSNKNVSDRHINALRIEAEIDIDPDMVMEVFQDVEGYPLFLESATAIQFRVLNKGDNKIRAYQYLEVPLFHDRHYVYTFNYYTKTDMAGKELYRSFWTLDIYEEYEEEFRSEIDINPGDAVYLDYGVGVAKAWIDESSGKTHVEYRLYIDPAGKIPDFIIRYVNRKGIVDLFRDLLNEAERRGTGS